MKPSYLLPILLCSPTQKNDELALQVSKLVKTYTDHPIQEINRDESLSIEQVRDFQHRLAYANPNQVIAYLITDIDKASLPAMHALLKILEEPPKNTLIILTTSGLNRVLKTIQSRCTIIQHQTENTIEDFSHFSDAVLSSYKNCIECAKEHKEYDSAKKLIEQLLEYYHSQLSKEQTNKLTKLNLLLQHALQDLDTATSPQLVLEHCFFEMRKILKK